VGELHVDGANWYENELPAREPVVAEPKLALICAAPSIRLVIAFARAKLSEPVSPSVDDGNWDPISEGRPRKASQSATGAAS
jgi:hypothetical protein